MCLRSSSVLLRKLSQVDIKFLRAMLKVEGWLQNLSIKVTNGTAPSLQSSASQFGKVAEMLTSGDRLSEQDANGNTPLHLAFLELGDSLVVDLLMGKYLEETTRNLSNADGLSFLHITCTRPYVDVVKKVLLNEHVNVNCKVNQRSTSTYPGYTPLHFAVKFDQREVAELLLARYNANLYEQDARGSTPLLLALECGNFAMMDLLLAYDRRRKNIVNDRGLSHFMAACAGSDELTVVEYLRAAPASQLINAIVDYVAGYRFAGYTPLGFAVVFGHANTARLLMDRSARERTPSSFSDSPDRDDYHSSSWSESSVHGQRSVCAESLCFMLEIFACALFLILLLPNGLRVDD